MYNLENIRLALLSSPSFFVGLFKPHEKENRSLEKISKNILKFEARFVDIFFFLTNVYSSIFLYYHIYIMWILFD